MCVGWSICLLVKKVLWQSGLWDPDAIWDGEWGWLRDGWELDGGHDHLRGGDSFGSEFVVPIVTCGEFVA